MELKFKKCGCCGIIKDITSWHKNKARIDGLHSICKVCRAKSNKKYNKKYWSNNCKYKNKFIVMAHYSNGEMCCNKCRFNNIKALEIDHINNNGCEHRKEIKGGHIYKWLIKNNFPDGFQVLCATCNALKRIDSNLNNKAKNKYPYKDKFIVVAHYSIGEMCCRNCRYSNIKGLQVDHINGKGRQHNTSIKTSLYNWLIKNDFPEGFQILCRNCNVIKRWDNEEYANQYTKGV